MVDSSLGKILADKSGNTRYTFAEDTATTSVCTAACATKCPPVVGPVAPGVGLDATDLATITRPDGTEQATFYGHPLYHFDGDTKPGNTNGQGVGGVWYVIDSEGKATGATTTAGTTTTAGASPGY